MILDTNLIVFKSFFVNTPFFHRYHGYIYGVFNITERINMMRSAKIISLLLPCLIFCFNNAKAETLENMYQNFKNEINKKYGLDYSVDFSVLEQKTSPNGENNAVQAYIYPSFSIL